MTSELSRQPRPSGSAIGESPDLEETDCPICRSPRFRTIRTVRDVWYGIPGTFQIVRCLDCTHCYLNPRPTPASIVAYYPDDYAPYHAPAGNTGNEPDATPRPQHGDQPWYLSRAVRAVPGLRRLYYWLTDSRAVWIPGRRVVGSRALELGCSDGVFLQQLRQQGWDPVGIEPATQPAQRAQQRGLEVRVGTLQPGMFPHAAFDACFAWMVIEHLHEPAQTVREVRHLLKQDGWLVFSVPNYASLERRVFGAYWSGLDPPRHLQHFRPRVLKRLLTDCGFTDVRIIYHRNVLSLIQSLGLLVRARKPDWRVGPALLSFVQHPTMWPQLALSPFAKLLAWTRLASQLTVIARSPGAIDDQNR